MTRVNVVPVQWLSDLWLLAEYRELPRCIKQLINTDNAPEQYLLGKGHMAWAKHHSLYLICRYVDIYNEMKFRGFKTNYEPVDLDLLCWKTVKETDYNDYTVTEADIALNSQRLLERYRENPTVHKWTKRNKPEWLKEV